MIAGPRAEAASTQRREAPSEMRPTASQSASRYSRVCPDPRHASPQFDDQSSEPNVQAVYAAKRTRATKIHWDPILLRNTPVIEMISIHAARRRATRAQLLR